MVEFNKPKLETLLQDTRTTLSADVATDIAESGEVSEVDEETDDNLEEIELKKTSTKDSTKDSKKDSNPAFSDFIDEETEEELEESEEAEGTEELEETEFETAAKELFEKGIIYELPDGVEEIPDFETFAKVLKHNQELTVKKATENVYTELEETLSPLAKDILAFDLESKKSGGDLVEFAKSLLYTADISNLDVEDPIDQEEIIRQYYEAKNLEEKDIETIINGLQNNPEALQAKAEELKPKLVELAQKEAEKQIRQQKLVEQEETEKYQYLSNKLAEQLQKGKIGKIVDGIEDLPLTAEEAQWLYKASLDQKVPAVVKGKKVEMEIMEALSHYHKYHKDGNINLYMTALMLLKDPEKVVNHLKKLATKEVIKDVRADNAFGNTGSGLKFNKKTEKKETPKAKKTRLFNPADFK